MARFSSTAGGRHRLSSWRRACSSTAMKATIPARERKALRPETANQQDRSMSIRLTTTLLTVALLAMSFALAEAQPQPRPPQPKGGGGGGGQPSQSGEIITSTTPEVTARLL